MAILADLRDPRVKNVTVVGVEVAPDMRSAKVAVSIMGAENKQQLTLNALQNAAGFLQAKIAERIDTRYTPKLTFVMDRGVKHSLEVLRILSEVLPPDASGEAGIDDTADETEHDNDDHVGGLIEPADDDPPAEDAEDDADDVADDDPDDFANGSGSDPAKPR